jgi:predicted O-methyltransferase YrrM
VRSQLHFLKFLLGVDQPETQVTAPELTLLTQYASEANVVVEIGCYEGATTVALAESSKGSVYTIDPFFGGRLGVCYGELIARFHCWKRGLKNIQFLKGLSYDIAPQFEKSIDLLFVDADHTFEGVKRDWEDWFPKVKKGGIIALHDSLCVPCSPDYLGSMKFYEEYLSSLSEVEQVGSVDSLVVLKVTG